MKKNHLAIWVTAALLSLPFSSAFAADAADATAPAMEQGMQQGQMPEGQPPEGMMPPGGFNPPGEVTQGTSANTISKNETVKGAVYMSMRMRFGLRAQTFLLTASSQKRYRALRPIPKQAISTDRTRPSLPLTVQRFP